MMCVSFWVPVTEPMSVSGVMSCGRIVGVSVRVKHYDAARSSRVGGIHTYVVLNLVEASVSHRIV